MPVDSTWLPQMQTAEYIDTYIEDAPYKRPETATEKWARLRLAKRRNRALKNGRKLL